MNLVEFFSPDYFAARERFRKAAWSAGAELEAHSVSARGPGDEELTLDVAILGPLEAPQTVVFSSGMHGVEGYFGSAVQLAVLQRIRQGEVVVGDRRVVLVHGLNPYGFAWGRRTNEQNVDLNRNWLLRGEVYRGSPPLYRRIHASIHRAGGPGWMDATRRRILWAALRWGRKALLETLPVGQYDFPQGVFFGGHAPTETHQIVREQLARWVGQAPEILHLDWHTGLGAWATGKLLLDVPAHSPHAQWFIERFGAEKVSPEDTTSNQMYSTRGAWGPWCVERLPDRQYRFATVEFGTYGMLRMITSLIRENRATLAWPAEDARLQTVRKELKEVFCPRHSRWQQRVVEEALKMCDLLFK